MEPNTAKTETLSSVEAPFFGNTKDGKAVYDREDGSHFHTEGGMSPELLASALSIIDTKDRPFVLEQVDFDRPVGEQTCVPVGPDDEIEMVFRKGRSGPTPMVKNREPIPCNSTVVILCKENPDSDFYRLVTSYVGELATREPWDPNISSEEEKKTCEEFWNTHALLYDENLIDMERTRGYLEMAENNKKTEEIREKTIYAGIFVDPEDLYGKVSPRLEKSIKDPHITTKFKPGVEDLNLGQLGTGAKITAVGYGNDGRNEGLLVQIEADEPEIQKACDALERPHITLSVSEEGRPKDTVNLEFSPLETPIELTGRYGLFIQGKPEFSFDDNNENE